MVAVSNYLVCRFQMRSGLPDVTRTETEEIWHDSKHIEEISNEDCERRYNEEYDIILVREGDIVKTVLDATHINRFYEGKFCSWCGKNKLTEDDCEKCDGRCLESSSRTVM